MAKHIFILILLLNILVSFCWKSLKQQNSVRSHPRNVQHTLFASEKYVGSVLKTPESVAKMMKEAAMGVANARQDKILLGRIDIPLPVTGGTELDDWPGGIKQKFSTLLPMLSETMRALNFTSIAMNERAYVDNQKDDAVGIWDDNGYTLISFPTPDSIPYIQQLLEGTVQSIVVMVNHQIFLNSLSKQQSKDFLNRAEVCYMLESLNMKGPNAMPIRGLIYRCYPDPFLVARRLDKGKCNMIVIDELYLVIMV
jgi:hypothetical protein